MTDARERIAQMLVAYRTGKNGMLAVETADAILAAMPDIVRGMVKPLVWEDNPDRGEGGFIAHSISDTYQATRDGWSIHRSMKWHDADGEYEAKAAANDHNAAQVLKALGL